MPFFRRLFIFSLCVVCFSSCASTAGKARDNRLYINITDDSRFFLLNTEEIEQNMDMVQYLSADFRGRKVFFIAWVMADENSMEMAFFNELGASIGELSYTNDSIHFSSTVIPGVFLGQIRPEYIVADFQLCFYNPVVLSHALEDIGLVLEIQGDNRRILRDDEVIIDIIKTDTSVNLENFLRGYTYTMEGDFLGN